MRPTTEKIRLMTLEASKGKEMQDVRVKDGSEELTELPKEDE